MIRRDLLMVAAAILLTGTTIFACPAKGMASAKASMQKVQPAKPMKHMVRNVIAAVSQTGMDREQTQKVTEAINTFKATNMRIRASMTPPLDAFKDDAFDREAFMNTVMGPKRARAMAKADLLESIYGILDAEQKKVFKRAYTAPMIEQSIRKNMIKGSGMSAKRCCATPRSIVAGPAKGK